MARHAVFTIVTDIKSRDEEVGLDTLLKTQYREDAFASIEQLHFACFVIFDRTRLADENAERVHSKLVLECNIDGSIDEFLPRLADHPICDDVYRHCVGYAGGSREEKVRFLHCHVKRPNLYHIGAPYRSARGIKADLELRRALDLTLGAAMNPSLINHLNVSPSGIREYWWADLLRPWQVWMIGVGGPAAALWVGMLTWQRVPLPALVRTVFLIAYGLFAIASIVAAFKIWVTSRPELRNRVTPWLQWLALGIAWLLAAQWIAVRNPERGLIVAGALAVLTAFRVWSAVARRTNERLLDIRDNSAAPPLVSVWRALCGGVPPLDERPAIFERLVNWSGWLFAYGTFVAITFATRRPASRFLIMIAVVFFAKSVWLAVLLGWPADRPVSVREDRHRIWAFMLGVPVLAALGFAILRSLSDNPWLLAAVILVSLFSLWIVPLPSPEPIYTPLAGKTLEELTDEEDRDVQNHMSAVVVLRRDRPYRGWTLRLFLVLLNRLFFRAWLPDLYRGKLFGIPTVHFAQWVLLDDRNYLFLSNYDNSWTTYLDDFGRRLESGIQKIWGQGDRNPGTKDLARFKHFARTTMVKHSLWCRNYPGVTVRQQWNNAHLRRALVRSTGEEQMIGALRRFGAAPKTLPDLSHGRVN
jgi:hypothetical protein